MEWKRAFISKWDGRHLLVLTPTLRPQPARISRARIQNEAEGKGAGALLGSGGQREGRAPQTPEPPRKGCRPPAQRLTRMNGKGANQPPGPATRSPRARALSPRLSGDAIPSLSSLPSRRRANAVGYSPPTQLFSVPGAWSAYPSSDREKWPPKSSVTFYLRLLLFRSYDWTQREWGHKPWRWSRHLVTVRKKTTEVMMPSLRGCRCTGLYLPTSYHVKKSISFD
ncbi:uncharacterized protein LOC132227153 [Myotis daubentonii]|uniref:uncharacterized protein LOC132227153 n=1 Tax=Myotis daubentonii TaxID=98922 RepID=UPI0028732A56|nr:uncharacterized protein LOC132227153 [Myotis daubentonii]